MTIVETQDAVVTPPRGLRILYRAFGWRLEGPYRPWVVADFADPKWMRRYQRTQVLLVLGGFGLLAAIFRIRLGSLPWAGIGGFIGSLLSPFLFPDRARNAAARRQLLPGTDPGPWSELSNGAWMAVTAGVTAFLLAMLWIYLPVVDSSRDRPQPVVSCATPSPEVTIAVLNTFGNSEVYRPTRQVKGPGDTVLVRVGPPVSLYAAVSPRPDGTLDVQQVALSSPGIYETAINNLDTCN